MLEKTISIILAGGMRSRLHPLTAERVKPAVAFAGRYRIIPPAEEFRDAERAGGLHNRYTTTVSAHDIL